MSALVVACPGSERLGERLALALGAELAALTTRTFPDQERYVRLDSAPEGRDVVVLTALDRPDSKVLQMLFVADLARELGAGRVILAAPYLAYMRQDTRFAAGEAVTSRTFARLICASFDALVTIDPHLHRYETLAELYSIPARSVPAAPLLAAWIEAEVEHPVLIGPDTESEQWVADVAERAAAPHVVLEKVRHGDRDVEVSVPDLARWHDRRPVIVDDIVSSARTMIATVRHLRRAVPAAPVCVGVHAVFAGDAYRALRQAGAERIATTNTISHESNAIDVSEVLAAAVADSLA